jgi:dethiobiotin synthetase
VSDRVVVVSGTATEVGKTWVACRLARALTTRGLEVSARKPAQSFEPGAATTDAALLAGATGEPEHAVCPAHRSYPLAMAPPMAADALGRAALRLDDLLAELALPERGVTLVEGVGGPRSPLTHDADTVALADALDAALVVLVAPSGLGAINDVLLASSAFGDGRVGVFLNRFSLEDPLHVANRRWLGSRVPRVHTTLESLVDVVADGCAVAR